MSYEEGIALIGQHLSLAADRHRETTASLTDASHHHVQTSEHLFKASTLAKQLSVRLVECSICTEMVNDPRKTPCGHIFCAKCITGSLANDPRCPYCRNAVLLGDLRSALQSDVEQSHAHQPPATLRSLAPTGPSFTAPRLIGVHVDPMANALTTLSMKIEIARCQSEEVKFSERSTAEAKASAAQNWAEITPVVTAVESLATSKSKGYDDCAEALETALRPQLDELKRMYEEVRRKTR